MIKSIDGDLKELLEEAKKTKPKCELDAEEMDKIIENEIVSHDKDFDSLEIVREEG